MTRPIISFSGESAFLSNFASSPLVVNGFTWPTVEHIYQAFKASEAVERELIRLAPSAGQAKKLGQTIQLPANWETQKVVVMARMIQAKFANETQFASKLLATGDAHLIEGNTWHDNFWGDCICYKCSKTIGENMLGEILMIHREELKESFAVNDKHVVG